MQYFHKVWKVYPAVGRCRHQKSLKVWNLLSQVFYLFVTGWARAGAGRGEGGVGVQSEHQEDWGPLPRARLSWRSYRTLPYAAHATVHPQQPRAAQSAGITARAAQPAPALLQL